MQQREPIVIRTGYASHADLSIYVDGFLKGQAVALSLIAQRLSDLGFQGAGRLVEEVLEQRRYRFQSRDDDGHDGWVPCPACGRLGLLP